MRLAAIVLLLVAGIFAGAQLGKIAPLAAWYQSEIGFSLVLIGWLTSVIGVFVALAALPAGWAIETYGMRRSVVVGSILLSAGSLSLPFLARPEAILTARLVEGIGYLILVIALPAVLSAIARPAWRAPVLAIWSCFVPAGFAIADLTARLMLPDFQPPTYLLTMALGYVIFAGAGILLLSKVDDASDTAPVRSDPNGRIEGAFSATFNLPVLLIAICFGFWVVQSVAFFSFMPAYLAGGGTLLLSAGIIALLVPIGNVAAGVLVRGASARRMAALSVAFLAVTAATSYPAFAGGPPLAATLSAVAVAVAGGVVGSALYAAIPAVVPRGGSVSIAIGLVAQAGGIGTLFGPPVAGWIIEAAGWKAFGLFLTAITLAGLLAILPNAMRMERRGAR